MLIKRTSILFRHNIPIKQWNDNEQQPPVHYNFIVFFLILSRSLVVKWKTATMSSLTVVKFLDAYLESCLFSAVEHLPLVIWRKVTNLFQWNNISIKYISEHCRQRKLTIRTRWRVVFLSIKIIHLLTYRLLTDFFELCFKSYAAWKNSLWQSHGTLRYS